MIYWYLFFLLPVVTGLAHLALLKRPLKAGTIHRVFVLNVVFWGIGAAGIFGFLVNSCGFLENWIARDLGWASGSPFQIVLGVGLLAIGVLGVLAPVFQGTFLLGTIVIGVTYGVGEGFVVLFNNVPTHYLVYTIIYDWGGSAILLMLASAYWTRVGPKAFCKCCVPEYLTRCFPPR